MSKVNEDKMEQVEKALEALYHITVPVNDTGRYINIAKDFLEKAIAPDQPEIPAGCPVLGWYQGSAEKEAAFYLCKLRGVVNQHKTIGGAEFEHVEIDYQRKGHVIPWNGGDMERLGVDTSSANLCVFTRDGAYGPLKKCVQSFNWMWKNREQEGYDIIAYVIWPEWVKS